MARLLLQLVRTMSMAADHTTHTHTAHQRPKLEFAPTIPLQASRLLLDRTERALAVGDLDSATYTAEKLLELAGTGNDVGALRVVAENAALLNRVFEAKLGPPERRIEVGIVGLEPGALALSQRATELLELARGGTTVRELLANCGFPRRHAARMVAGLLRRHVLVAL